MGGGGACAVLAHRMPLPCLHSSSWPIERLSLLWIPRHGPSHASTLGGFLVMARRTPPPCLHSSSWPIACLDLGWVPRPGPSNASPLPTFLVLAHRMSLPWPLGTFLVMAHRMPPPWVDSSSWPIACLPLGWGAPPGKSNAAPLCGFLQQDSATLIPTNSFINSYSEG